MNNVSKPLLALTGIALAAVSTYMLDPENGKRRRAAVGERCRSAARKLDERSHTLRDELSHRYQDASTRARSWLNSGDRADRGLARRIRLDLWRAVPSSKRVAVVVHGGDVILHGEVLAAEHEHVLEIVRSVEGVESVADHLSERTDVTPQMSATGMRRGYAVVRDNLTREHWTAPTRVVSSVAGLSLMGWGVAHRNLFGVLGALLGAAFVTRGATNVPFKRWTGRGKRVMQEIDDSADAAAEHVMHAGNNLGVSEDWQRPAAAAP